MYSKAIRIDSAVAILGGVVLPSLPYALAWMAVGYILLPGGGDTIRPPASAEPVGGAP